LFIYLPFNNGGIGVRNVKAQYLIFKIRAIIKAFNANEKNPFLSDLKTVAKEILFQNTTASPKLQILLDAINTINFRFSQIPKRDLNDIGLGNQIVFHNYKFPCLISNGYDTIGKALAINNETISLRITQLRKLNMERKMLDKALVVLKNVLDLSEEKALFDVHDFISNSRTDFNRISDYRAIIFAVIKLSNVNNKDLLTLRSKKWERLKMVRLPLNEKSVIWRLWHCALINYHIASLMGLVSNSKCPYCFTVKPDC